MNQTQRKFLIDKITSKTDLKIKVLEATIPERPLVINHLTHAIMSDTIQLKSNKEIKEVIRQKALNSTDKRNVFGDGWRHNTSEITFKAKEIFIIPKEFAIKEEEYTKMHKKVYEEIKILSIQSETLITRIQLASDKTLQLMINEIDDMGDISLLDTTLKEITLIGHKQPTMLRRKTK